MLPNRSRYIVPVPVRKLLNEFQPQSLLIELEAGIDIADYDSNA